MSCRVRLTVALRWTIALVVFPAVLFAATPSSGTLSDTNSSISFTAGPFFVSNPTGFVSGDPICLTSLQCDDFTLNVNLPADYATTHPRDVITISVQWPTKKNDFDVFVLRPDGTEANHAASSADPEVAILSAGSGSYTLTVRVVPFLVTGDSISGTITLSTLPSPPPPGSGTAPRFQNYAAPNGLATDAGEPSIGANLTTGNVLFQAYTETLRVRFNDATSPAISNWKETESQITAATSLDPILFHDQLTGRTFASQLAGATSLMAFSDDDGETWTPSQGGGIGTIFDHQTVGGGRWSASGVGGSGLYPDAVYYCAHDDVSASCAASRDGGITFGPGVPIYTLTDCGGLHGHIKVGPDGAAYVPNGTCLGGQGVVVTEDNGLTWEIRKVPGSTESTGNDPSLAIGPGGTLYFGYENGDGHPWVAVSSDHGRTWRSIQDVGVTFGIKHAVFPVVTVGDDDRAAFGFLGSSADGDYQDPNTFNGEWHLYIATTYDRGQTWITVDATPNDPVQRGSICNKGTLDCGDDRNLLDFMDATVDKEGRILVGYADGCTGGCVAAPPNSVTSLGTIARQSGGRRLFARFDPTEPSLPPAPLLSAIKDAAGNHLTWPMPDNNGSPITNYKVYRGTMPGAETFLANTGEKTAYDDTAVIAGTTYYYRVNGVNGIGEGSMSNEVTPVPAPVVPHESACRTPGITVSSDASGDQVGAPANSQLDIKSVSIAEPYFPDGSSKLVFTIKVSDLAVVPPNSTWKVVFKSPNNTTYFVDMSTFDPSGIKYEYGHIVVDPTTGVNQNVTDGPADPASGYSTIDGTIVLVIANSNVGNPAAGQALGGVYGVTQLLVGATRGLLEQVDATPKNNYALVGNASCLPNNPPVAGLTATPTSGFAPLAVAFDGSGSADPDGDTIATYTFDFGDGTPIVSQSTPSVSHTYSSAGSFTATLSVTDSRGASSDQKASVAISVTNPPASPGSISGSGFFDKDGRIDFKLNVASNLTGSFSYEDVPAAIKFDSSSITSYSQSGRCATFGGNATLTTGGEVTFTVTACDNGDPGRDRDTFAISVSGARSVSHSGTIATGNIKLHTN